ncbi:hypothetical protein J3F84DRAFT_362628 [Trichoderma pleuroticola]
MSALLRILPAVCVPCWAPCTSKTWTTTPYVYTCISYTQNPLLLHTIRIKTCSASALACVHSRCHKSFTVRREYRCLGPTTCSYKGKGPRVPITRTCLLPALKVFSHL